MDLQGVIFWGNFVSAHLFCPEYSAHSAESLQGKSRIQSRHLVLQLLLRGVFWFCFFNAGDENAKQVLFYWVTFPLGPSITSWVAQSDLGLAILPQPPQDIYICPCAWPTYDLDDSEWDVFFFDTRNQIQPHTHQTDAYTAELNSWSLLPHLER